MVKIVIVTNSFCQISVFSFFRASCQNLFVALPLHFLVIHQLRHNKEGHDTYNYNPLHVSPDFAQMVGFKEPILHGLCTLGFSARACIKAMCGNDPSLFKSIKLRFSKPVIPGDTLVVKMWNEGNGRVVFTTSVKGGAVVINNAVFEMHTGAKM